MMQEKDDSLAEALSFVSSIDLDSKYILTGSPKIAAITRCNSNLIYLRSGDSSLMGHKNISPDVISLLIYSISHSSNPVTG